MAPKKAKVQKVDDNVSHKKVDGFRVAYKAGLLTYNNPVFGDGDINYQKFLEEMRDELRGKFKQDIIFSLCVEQESRVHLHLFFQCEFVIDCDLQYFATKKSGKVSDCKPNNGKNVDQGHWYVQTHWKKSHICSIFDRLIECPAEKWLMDKWKQRKIDKIKEALADHKLLKPQLIQQIDCQNNYYENQHIQKLLGERQAALDDIIVPFVVNDTVENWKEQFTKLQHRYSFLVLCGPSKMRKTEFAKSLFKNAFHHKDKIDWDGYSWLNNGSIIFDDCNNPDHIWKFVKQNKMMFQASGVVPVNTSATNCYKRDICVAQKPIIVCTNDQLCDKYCTEEYRQWIVANCVWVNVVLPFRYEGDDPAYRYKPY